MCKAIVAMVGQQHAAYLTYCGELQLVSLAAWVVLCRRSQVTLGPLRGLWRSRHRKVATSGTSSPPRPAGFCAYSPLNASRSTARPTTWPPAPRQPQSPLGGYGVERQVGPGPR